MVGAQLVIHFADGLQFVGFIYQSVCNLAAFILRPGKFG